MKPEVLLLSCYLISLLCFTAQCSYEWDYDYPEIDLQTGWPLYQVQNGDTLSHISTIKYGSPRFWMLLKGINLSYRDDIFEDSLLETPLKIVIPPRQNCIQFMDESCLLDEEELSINDGGMQDNRRFLEAYPNLTEWQSKIHTSTKKSHSFVSTLLNTGLGHYSLVLENHSNRTFTSWSLIEGPYSKFKQTMNKPFQLAPGSTGHISLNLDIENRLQVNRSFLIQTQIADLPNCYIKIYIGIQTTYDPTVGAPLILVLYSENGGYIQSEIHNIIPTGSWNTFTHPNLSPLNLYYYVSRASPVVGMFIFQDLLNLFESSQFWKISSGQQYLQFNTSDIWSIQLLNSLTQQYTITQDNMYLGLMNDTALTVSLTSSIFESPSEFEIFHIIKCDKNATIDQYEVSQGQYILKYDSNQNNWIFKEKDSSSSCSEQSLSIDKYP